ncbi:uncharacterized protein LOC134527127 isoform X2 [Bacillus rossius redtenbacheri]|uniref:uncharacterized protein LOC134527127 isoform X2 n=1 Tax=Bacillus rossius redtenbacheri TaxID=93214 RepID=UPI002FDD752C
MLLHNIACAMSCGIRAVRNGGRLPYLWFAIILHGLVVEVVSYNLPDIDNFWHSQTPLILAGRRLPIHIVFLYCAFIYNASVAVSKARLPNWAEPFAVGLCSVLIDLPYDIVSVKFVHWTWHDTDPNIYDRHYWVPWTSYYFHASFAASLTFWFHASHRWIASPEKWRAGSAGRELACAALAGLLGFPGGVLLFVLAYHPLHDACAVHSEVAMFLLLVAFLAAVWSADREPAAGSRPAGRVSRDLDGRLIILVPLFLHYALFLCLAMFGNPEEEVSVGLHEPIGPCNETVTFQNPLGMDLKKRKYLCVSDYEEDYFSFSCLPRGAPPSGSVWYTVCGTPFANRAEYVAVIGCIAALGAVVFYNLHFKSGEVAVASQLARPKQKKK